MGQPLPTSLYLRRPSLEGPRAPHRDHFPELPPRGFLTVLRVMGRSCLCPQLSWAKCYRVPEGSTVGAHPSWAVVQVSCDGEGRGGGYLEAPTGPSPGGGRWPRQCLPAEPAKPGVSPRGTEAFPRAAHTPQLPAPGRCSGRGGHQVPRLGPTLAARGAQKREYERIKLEENDHDRTSRSGRAPGRRPWGQGTPWSGGAVGKTTSSAGKPACT